MSDYFPIDPRVMNGSLPRRRLHDWQSQAQREAEAYARMAAEEAERAAANAAREAAEADARPAEVHPAATDASPDKIPETLPVATGDTEVAASLTVREPDPLSLPHEIPDPLPAQGRAIRDDEDETGDEAEVAGEEEAPDPELIGWTPPPRKPRKQRHDEWTRQKMVLFLREPAASQSVAQAARSVGLSRQSAYRLRARLVATPFALGWEVALEAGLAQLAHAMLDRAVNGVEVPHYFKGELVGSSRHYDERLAIWLMSNPWKIGRQQLAREYSAEGFDRLLERIETGPLGWLEEQEEAADQPPGLMPPAVGDAEDDEGEEDFLDRRSWYAAEAGAPSGAFGRGRGR